MQTRLKELAKIAIKAVYGKIDPFRRENSFEIFGLDFMLDDDFKPYLIEINTNPCLDTSSTILARLIPQMIEQAF